jgi:hypothetical protein
MPIQRKKERKHLLLARYRRDGVKHATGAAVWVTTDVSLQGALAPCERPCREDRLKPPGEIRP